MDSIIESFFDNFSNDIDRKRIENRKDLERSYQSALSILGMLGKKSGSLRKLQNPFSHSRVSFPETSSTYSFLEDLIESLPYSKIQSSVDDYSFFATIQNMGENEKSILVIEGRAGREGTIDLLFYFSKRSQILSFSKSDDFVEVIFLFDGSINRTNFSKISKNSFSAGDFLILTENGNVSLDSEIVSERNNI